MCTVGYVHTLLRDASDQFKMGSPRAYGQMTEEMIKNYLEHHFEANPNDDFKTEP